MRLAAGIGTITAPPELAKANPVDPQAYVAGFVRNGISLLLIVAFILSFLFTIIAGIKFVTSGGDEKAVSSAWSSIYYGFIGMLIVIGSYAIIRLIETFFGVSIISSGFQLPTP